MRIAIAGGSGTVGRHVAVVARTAGHDVVVLSRANGVDLLNPDRLAARLDGVDALIDVSSTGTLSSREATRYFGTVTDHLLAAEWAAGVAHHVVLSIIGAAGAPSGHYAGKAVQEQKVRESGDRWSMLRTTQFHEFAAQTVERGTTAGVFLAPVMRTQPIAAADVAAELVRIAESAPAGLVPDLAGPEVHSMPDLVRRYARAIGRTNRVLAVPLPGKGGAAMRKGDLLPAPGTRLAGPTFNEWLTTAVSPPPR